MSNQVPEGWQERTIGDIATVFAGGTPSRSNPDYYSGSIPWVKSGEVNSKKIYGTSEHISELAVKESSAKWAEKGSVLVAMYGATAGKVAKLMIDATLNQAVSAISGKYGIAENDYLLQAIESGSEVLLNAVQGSGQPNLSGQLIKGFSVLVPPLPEQQKIAKILTSVDEVIEKTQAQIDKLKDLKTGMMQELLTQGVGVDGKPHTEFKDSPVGRIPKTWKVVSLSSVAERIGDGIHATPKYVDKSDYPFINGNNLKDGKIFVGSNTRFVSLEEYEKHRTELSDSTILMSINGTIGNLAYYLNEPVVLGKSAAYISLAEGVSKSFIYYVLGSDYVREFYELELTGTTIRNLSLKAIRATPIALPPAVEQDDIARVLSALDENIKLLSSQLSQKMSLKKALMQDLLTGKVRVAID
ncbi:restriction endonuclease subunit S [Shewanella indica]|uniref:restriction endonuclease subunit S n=1 Tax=Shewanella indica TaxID=768528 RepID=UPI003007A3DA